MLYRIVTVCLAVSALLIGPAVSSSFQPWSENVFTHIGQEYGPDAEKRFRFLHQFIIENQDIPDMEKVQKTNEVLNNLPWIADSQHWKESDYWASPLETIATFGGDCEDIAIAKWVVLRNLGISADHLALAYVKIKKTGEDHMVLLFVSNPSAPIEQMEVYVLDNYVDGVKRGKERTDLLAVYAFDAKGTVVLFQDDGTNRSVKGVYEERKLRQVDELIAKVSETREQFKKLNDGRPFMPGE
jgi:predicted transglutaminase-like cysteine proteinase